MIYYSKIEASKITPWSVGLTLPRPQKRTGICLSFLLSRGFGAVQICTKNISILQY